MNTVKTTLKKLTTAVLVAGVMTTAHAPLASAASNYWNGAGDNSSFSDAANWSLGRAPATSDIAVFNSAASTEEAVFVYNDQSNLRLNGITFTGASSNGYLVAGNTIQMAGEIRDQNTGNSISYLSNNILTTGTVKISTVNNAWLFTNGKYTINNHALYLRAYHNSINFFDGAVVGTAGSTVYVVGDNSGSTVFGVSSNITRPTVVKDKGKLWPGRKMNTLTVATSGYMHNEVCINTKNLRIEGYYYVYINGDPTCSENYGRINVTGTVNITNGKLSFANNAIGGSYKPVIGAKYVLVSNDGTDKVIGAYKNRPEGSVVKIGSRSFKITYKGGTGNDIVLTRLP